ncbi:TetR/AcrR family transcriptional regulator [Pseudomonas sp. CR3202]|uniref:TetR/AcrR family transcriptional regulator n=1 Tax=Pseudomonas sp. CR3202 TaxID=3351532 RepID=UPI003BF23EE3
MSSPEVYAIESVPCPSEEPVSRYEEVRHKALELFAERGFARSSMRELAARLGLLSGSLYHHFRSKESLLFELIEEVYDDLLEAALATGGGDAHDRLQGLLRAHIDLLESRSLHFLVAEHEFRYLSQQHQNQILQMRRCYEDILLKRLLDAGATARLPLLKATVQGVVGCLNNLPTWLNQAGLSAAEGKGVIAGIVFGSLSGVLKQQSPLSGSATIVPLHGHSACS